MTLLTDDFLSQMKGHQQDVSDVYLRVTFYC